MEIEKYPGTGTKEIQRWAKAKDAEDQQITKSMLDRPVENYYADVMYEKLMDKVSRMKEHEVRLLTNAIWNKHRENKPKKK
jgi:hypothetical protein